MPAKALGGRGLAKGDMEWQTTSRAKSRIDVHIVLDGARAVQHHVTARKRGLGKPKTSNFLGFTQFISEDSKGRIPAHAPRGAHPGHARNLWARSY